MSIGVKVGLIGFGKAGVTPAQGWLLIKPGIKAYDIKTRSDSSRADMVLGALLGSKGTCQKP